MPIGKLEYFINVKNSRDKKTAPHKPYSGIVRRCQYMMEKNNIGISFLYETSVREELLNGSLVSIPIKNYDVKRKFKFVYRKYSTYDQEYLDFFDFCDDQRRILCL